MRDSTFNKADKAITLVAKSVSPNCNAEMAEAIDALNDLLRRYQDARNTIEAIEAKIFHLKRGD